MTAGKPAERPQSTSRLATDIVLLAGFCGFLFFFGLAYFGLVGADEPRYAQVAREMLQRHDWITPTLGGKPWLEKPPLYYWQAMVAYRIFGVSDWAARLPSAFDATLMVVAGYVFLRRFRTGFHLDGALIVASSAGVIGFARAASTDMPLAAMFTIALLAWYAWCASGNRGYLALFFLFLGLGVLAKGPVALLLGVSVVTFFPSLKRDFGLLKRTLWFPGIVIFLAVVMPWYGAVQIRNPEFFRVFILEHNLARFGTNLYRHPQPFWYYVPVVMLALFPWTVFVVAALSEEIGARWRMKRDVRPDNDFGSFLLIWLIVPVIFFSISKSKLPGYIIPAIPAGALLVAEYIRLNFSQKKPPRLWQIAVHAIATSAVLVPALMIQYILLQHRMPWGQSAVPLAVAAVYAITIILIIKVSGLRMLRFATLLPLVLAVGVALRVGSPLLDASLSARPVANEIAYLQPKFGDRSERLEVAVFEVRRETEFGLAFYLNRPIMRYERSEIPASAHLVIAPSGLRTKVADSVPGRQVFYLGTFAPQGLDYFWVSKNGN